jgi:hypothetical protein
MLTGLFGPRTFLEEGLEEWCLEAWAWLMRNLGGMSRLGTTPLVMANKDFFPPTTTEGAARGAYLFERVKGHMGMADWPCELESYDRAPIGARLGEFWSVNSHAPSGTFRIEDGRAIISYASDLVQDPRHLIGVFAHELSHYLLAIIEDPAPGGHQAHELMTELTLAYAGFGVFAANAAFSFGQHTGPYSQGWRSQRNGYFSERTWAFALALFLTLKDERGGAKAALKPSIAAMTAKADRYLNRNPDLLAPLREIA